GRRLCNQLNALAACRRTPGMAWISDSFRSDISSGFSDWHVVLCPLEAGCGSPSATSDRSRRNRFRCTNPGFANVCVAELRLLAVVCARRDSLLAFTRRVGLL